MGKSTLAQRLLQGDVIPWLPTGTIRIVLRGVLRDLDALDQDPVDPVLLAEFVYSHIEQAAEVCAEEAEMFLIDGFELAPWYRDRLRADLPGIEVRACFLGHETFRAVDLADYHGPNLNTKPRCRSPSLRLRRPGYGHEPTASERVPRRGSVLRRRR